MHLPLFMSVRERTWRAIALSCACFMLGLPRAVVAAGGPSDRVPLDRAVIAGEIEAPRFKTPAPAFQDGHAQPTGAWQKAPRARAMREFAQLVSQAATAFDQGEMERGRQLARRALEKLETAEGQVRERGNASLASKLATERARIHQRLLGDDAAARAAFTDALVDDGNNREAERALIELVERELAAEREAARPSDRPASSLPLNSH